MNNYDPLKRPGILRRKMASFLRCVVVSLEMLSDIITVFAEVLDEEFKA